MKEFFFCKFQVRLLFSNTKSNTMSSKQGKRKANQAITNGGEKTTKEVQAVKIKKTDSKGNCVYVCVLEIVV